MGPVPIRECLLLNRDCDFMLLSLLLACFSASYAKAMVIIKPILALVLGFAHSVCGEARLYFDPIDPDKIVLKLMNFLMILIKLEKLMCTGKKRLNQFNTSTERASEFISICKNLASSGR